MFAHIIRLLRSDLAAGNLPSIGLCFRPRQYRLLFAATMAKQTQYEFQWGLPKPEPAPVPEAPAQAMLFEASLPRVPDPEPQATTAASQPASRCLPVPKPLAEAVGKGHFGEDEHGPIRPTAAEIRAITEHHAEKLGDLLLGLEETDRSLRDSQCSDRARLYHERERDSLIAADHRCESLIKPFLRGQDIDR
jgi:hypothetical protein